MLVYYELHGNYMEAAHREQRFNLKNAVESTTSGYCTDSLRDFDDFLLHRMGDTISAKNRQNLSKNQHINHSRYDST